MTNPNNQRLIQVKGAKGLGKSAIVQYATQYCRNRDYFQDGAIFIKAQSLASADNFVE